MDYGQRVGEVSGLTVDCFDLKTGELTFYRLKVDWTQTHRLTPDTLAAARAYLAQDASAIGPIWQASGKGKGSKYDQPGGGAPTDQGMTTQAITERVKFLGAALDIAGLSDHDTPKSSVCMLHRE
jgi:integrase